MNAFFYTYNYGDFDNMSPIVYKMTQDKNFDKIRIISFAYDKNDYRKIFLEKHNIEILDAVDFVDSKSFYFKRSLYNFIDKMNNKVKNKIITFLHYYIKKEYFSSFYNDVNEKVLEKYFLNNENKKIFFFDRNWKKENSQLIHSLKDMGCKVFIYNEGLDISSNRFVTRSRVDIIKLENRKIQNKSNIFDALFLNNEQFVQKQIQKGILPEKLVIAGDPRFTNEWQNVLQEITPQKELPVNVLSKKYKFLVLTTKYKYNVNLDELVKMMDFMNQFKDIGIIMKGHPRDDIFLKHGDSFKLMDNVAIVDNSYHTFDLIQKSDVIFLTYSSLILDTLFHNKPLLILKSTFTNRLQTEAVKRDWEIECLDDLYYWIKTLYKDEKLQTYTQDEKRRIYEMLVSNISEDALQEYINKVVIKSEINDKNI